MNGKKSLTRIRPWLLLALAAGAVLVVAATTLYLLMSWRPARYDPPRLNQAQKEIVAMQFIAHIAEFSNRSQENRAYSWEMTESQANAYLDAMDEIAFQRPDSRDNPRRRGDVQRMMDRAGLAEPVVRFDNGRMMIMVRSNEHGKVISAEISFTFLEDDKLLVNLEATRIGLLPVPRFAVRGQLQRFKRQLQARLARMQEGPDQPQAGGAVISTLVDIEELFATIIAAIDSDPVQLRIRHVQVRDIIVEDGLLMLMVSPVDEDQDEEH